MKYLAIVLLALIPAACAGQAGMYLSAADAEISAAKKLEAAATRRAMCIGTNVDSYWQLSETVQRGMRMVCLGEDLPSGAALTLEQLRTFREVLKP